MAGFLFLDSLCGGDMIHRHGTIECCPLVNENQSSKDAARALVEAHFHYII